MSRITIDNIGIDAHNRYAKDMTLLDPVFLKEPSLIAPHMPNNGLSSIYSSKWEELFDLQKGNLPWATFTPPLNFFSAPPHLFSFYFFTKLAEDENGPHESETVQEEKEESPIPISLFQKKKKMAEILQSLRQKNTIDTFQDHSSLLSFLESIENLGKLFLQIHSRKLQFQKG